MIMMTAVINDEDDDDDDDNYGGECDEGPNFESVQIMLMIPPTHVKWQLIRSPTVTDLLPRHLVISKLLLALLQLENYYILTAATETLGYLKTLGHRNKLLPHTQSPCLT